MRLRGSSEFQKRSTSNEELRRELAAAQEAEAFCDSRCLGVRVARFRDQFMIVICSAKQAHRLNIRTNISREEHTDMEHDPSSVTGDFDVYVMETAASVPSLAAVEAIPSAAVAIPSHRRARRCWL